MSASVVRGGSHTRVISAAFTDITRTLLTDADVTDASVVTVISTKSPPSSLVNSLIPLPEKTWKRYVVTGLSPVIVTFVSLKNS